MTRVFEYPSYTEHQRRYDSLHGWSTGRHRLLAPKCAPCFTSKPSRPFDLFPKIHYAKVHAYRIKPLEKTGCLAVDGEAFPFEQYQVEVHQGLGTLLSPYGHYAAKFEPRAPKDLNKNQPSGKKTSLH